MPGIRLNGMKFFAYHGCLAEEATQGNHFKVDLKLKYNMDAASKSDELHDALDYQEAYRIVQEEMSVRSCLLEHLARCILDRLFDKFAQLDEAEIIVYKLNPPIGGEMDSVSVSQSCKRARFT